MKFRTPFLRRLLAAACALILNSLATAMPVFPGAVGYGTNTPAGRGGQIVRVTNLLDDYQNPPEGSFRWAVERVSGPRVIVFEVSGVIELKRYVVFRRDDSGTHGSVTVAGQTAPWPGITLKNAGLVIHANDVLIQHIAIRPGTLVRSGTGWDLPVLDNRDAIAVECPVNWSVGNVVIDHVSCSWATDEMVSVWGSDGPVTNVTFSNNIFSEPILNGGHSKGAHGYGPLMGKNGSYTSVLRNLMAFNWDRNPLVRGATGGSQVVNNFVYRPGKWATSVMYMGSSTMLNDQPVTNSFVGNLLRKHPVPFSVYFGRNDGTIPLDTHLTTGFTGMYVHSDIPDGSRLYLADNLLFDPATGTWAPSDGDPYNPAFFRDSPAHPVVRLDADPYANSGGTPWSPWPVGEVATRVTTQAGKFPAMRDAIDAGLVQKVVTETGTYVAFESDLGDDPWGAVNIQGRRLLVTPEDLHADSGDGYTNLEKWLQAFSAYVEGTGPVFPVPQPGAPVVTTAPMDREVEEGKTVTFMAAADGTGPFTWRWQKDGAALADDGRISGSGTPALRIANAGAADAGSYHVVVTSAAGTAGSTPATLSVTPMTAPALAVALADKGFTEGDDVPLTVRVTGTTPFVYQWSKDGVPLTESGHIHGTGLPTLSIMGAQSGDAGVYRLTVTNAAGSVTSEATLSLVALPAAPVSGEATNVTVSSFVANWSAVEGAIGYRLDVSTDPGFPTFVTGYNNLDVGNIQSRSVTPLEPGTVYYYRVRAFNEAGASASSGTVMVTTPGTGSHGSTILLDDDFATGRAGWYNLNNTTAANVSVVDGQLRVVPGVHVARYFPSTLLQVGESLELDFDFRLDEPVSQSSAIRFGLFNSQGQRVTKDGGASPTVPVYTGHMISFNPQPTGNNFIAIRRRIPGPTNTTLMASTGAAVYGNPLTGPRGTYQSPALSWLTDGLVYQGKLTLVRASATEVSWTFSMSGNGLGTAFMASSVAELPAENEAEFDTVAFLMTAGTATAFRLDDVRVTHLVPDPRQPPAIVDGPAEQTIVSGGNATFTVSATGIPAPSFQWRRNGVPLVDGGAVGGATSATLVLTGARAADAGEYDVVVSNEVGDVTSTKALLVVQKAPAVVSLGGLSLRQGYTGSGRSAGVTTEPGGLPVVILYNGATAVPVLPGVYTVEAVIDDPDYEGTVTGSLVIVPTAFVRHAPVVAGGLDGSVQVVLPESVTLNSQGWISGDLLVPGTPTLRLNGGPTHAGVLDGGGAATPANHSVTLNGSSLLRYLVTRVDPPAFETVGAPPAPAGTRNVIVNTPGADLGDFATLRNLTLNAGAGLVAVPPGTYGQFVANGTSGLVLGDATSSETAVYHLQSLTLNTASRIVLAGPVRLIVASGFTANGTAEVGDTPERLELTISAGGLTLNSGASFNGRVEAPSGTVTLNGTSTLRGRVRSDRLVINGGGLLSELEE